MIVWRACWTASGPPSSCMTAVMKSLEIREGPVVLPFFSWEMCLWISGSSGRTSVTASIFQGKGASLDGSDPQNFKAKCPWRAATAARVDPFASAKCMREPRRGKGCWRVWRALQLPPAAAIHKRRRHDCRHSLRWTKIWWERSRRASGFDVTLRRRHKSLISSLST